MNDERPMTRELAISTIEALYPADAEHEDCRAVGIELLDQAKREVNGWREEPDAVLIRYAQLCSEKERRDEARWERERRTRERGY